MTGAPGWFGSAPVGACTARFPPLRFLGSTGRRICFFPLPFKEKENSAISDNSNLQLERPNYTSNFPNAGFCFSEHLRRAKGNQISPAYTANLDQISGLRSVNSSRHLPGSVSSVPGLHKTTAQLICFT